MYSRSRNALAATELAAASIAEVDNQLHFADVSSRAHEGVHLDDKEHEYLLPHFLMLLIGKPGSGKTTLLKYLVLNKYMYRGKFDYIFVVSPSHSKMGLDNMVKRENRTEEFSLEWIFKRIEHVNDKYKRAIFGHEFSDYRKYMPQKVVALGDKNAKRRGISQTKSFVPSSHDRSRFFTADFLRTFGFYDKITSSASGKEMGSTTTETLMDKLFKEVQRLKPEEYERTHANALLILDDVVGPIKKNELDPRLAQLVMNRRHLILNGTLSIIIVSQKYTLIPARVRSSASWLVLFALNPLDFENVYRDACNEELPTWRAILRYVFGERFGVKSGGGGGDETLPGSKMHMVQKEEEDRKEGHAKRESRLENERIASENAAKEGKPGASGEVHADRVEESRTSKGDDKKTKKAEMSIGEWMKGKKYENLGIWVEFGLYFKNFKRLLV